ncbi:receptor like protein 22-like [Gossypium arboreum]|nr:receptor like protein 22-like [Gossypium arboreum]
MVTVSSISTLGQLEILNKSNIPFGLVQLFIANVIPFFVSFSNTFMSSPTEFCIATFPFPLVFVHTEFTLLLFIRRLLGMKVLTVANGRVCGVLLSSAFNITSLTFMDFSGNFSQGTLPNNISGLSYLDLYANLLSGRVPGWLFSLPSLEYLDLSSNKLNGPIDTIPSSFFDFMNLTFLDLSSNNLSGNIKSCMHVKLRNLRSLDLLFNNLPSLTRCSNDVNSTLPMIIEFHFSSCNMHRFASFLNVSKHLQVLDLSNNQIQAEGWEDLVTLNLSMNFLSSVEQIPRKHLFILDLRSNSLQGPLPTPPQELSYFLISNKELVGEISSKSCNLSFLHSVLDLSKNKLGGTIPDCFGTFSDQLSVIVLRTLSLSVNQLEGSIPQSLLQCSFDAFSNDSFDGNSGLSGFPLSKKYGNDQEPESLRSTVADKFETTLIWKMAAMGYGSRVVLRLNMGYIVFTTERPVG